MRFYSFASLRFRLLALVLLAIAPFLGLTLYTHVELRRLAAADVQEDVLRLARAAASNQRDTIQDTRQLLFAPAQLPLAQDPDPADCSAFNRLAAEAQLSEGATFAVFDRDGTILARFPDPETWLEETVPETPIVEAIAAHEREGTAQARDADGISRLYAFTLVPGTRPQEEVYISIGVPASVAFQSANQALMRNLVGLGIVTALVLVATLLGENLFVLRWVQRLLSATRRLSSGDLSVRTGLRYGAGGMSELARAFDEMADSLERRVAERDEAERALRESQHALLSAQQTLEQQVVARTRELSALYDVTAAALYALRELLAQLGEE